MWHIGLASTNLYGLVGAYTYFTKGLRSCMCTAIASVFAAVVYHLSDHESPSGWWYISVSAAGKTWLWWLTFICDSYYAILILVAWKAGQRRLFYILGFSVIMALIPGLVSLCTTRTELIDAVYFVSHNIFHLCNYHVANAVAANV